MTTAPRPSAYLLRVGRARPRRHVRPRSARRLLAILAPAASTASTTAARSTAPAGADTGDPLAGRSPPTASMVHAELNFAFAYMLDGLPTTRRRQPSDRSMRAYRADGRLVTVRLVRSSGVPRAIMRCDRPGFGRSAVDLSRSRAGGDPVELPPVDPMYDTAPPWNDRRPGARPARDALPPSLPGAARYVRRVFALNRQ